jgi:hypothetical protein
MGREELMSAVSGAWQVIGRSSRCIFNVVDDMTSYGESRAGGLSHCRSFLLYRAARSLEQKCNMKGSLSLSSQQLLKRQYMCDSYRDICNSR